MGLELSTVFVWHTLERSTKEEKGIHELRGMKKLGIAQEERDQRRETNKLEDQSSGTYALPEKCPLTTITKL